MFVKWVCTIPWRPILDIRYNIGADRWTLHSYCPVCTFALHILLTSSHLSCVAVRTWQWNLFEPLLQLETVFYSFHLSSLGFYQLSCPRQGTTGAWNFLPYIFLIMHFCVQKKAATTCIIFFKKSFSRWPQFFNQKFLKTPLRRLTLAFCLWRLTYRICYF